MCFNSTSLLKLPEIETKFRFLKAFVAKRLWLVDKSTPCNARGALCGCGGVLSRIQLPFPGIHSSAVRIFLWKVFLSNWSDCFTLKHLNAGNYHDKNPAMQTVLCLKEIDCSAKQSRVLGEMLMYVVHMDQVSGLLCGLWISLFLFANCKYEVQPTLVNYFGFTDQWNHIPEVVNVILWSTLNALWDYSLIK